MREIAHKEEKQLFTIIATGVFPRNSYFVYSSAHGVSVPAVHSLMDLNWNDVQHQGGRSKCRKLGSAAAGCLLGSSIWRLIGAVAQDTASEGSTAESEPCKGSAIPARAEPRMRGLWVHRRGECLP